MFWLGQVSCAVVVGPRDSQSVPGTTGRATRSMSRTTDLVAAAARSGATFFSTRPLKLDPSVKPHYVAFLSEHFPTLVPSTEARFAERVNPERGYTEMLEERARRVRSRYFFRERPFRRSEPTAPSQLRLAI